MEVTRSKLRQAEQPALRQDAPGRTRPSGGDSVAITSAASRLHQAEARLAGIPEVDRSRVEALRASLSAGTYSVDPARTAAAMLRLDGRLP